MADRPKKRCAACMRVLTWHPNFLRYECTNLVCDRVGKRTRVMKTTTNAGKRLHKRLPKKERDTLNAAAVILQRELLSGREVAIKGFGKFYCTTLTVHNSMDGTGSKGRRYSPKFRPFSEFKTRLKAIVGGW